ncbi:MAG: rhamnose ABC transporter substrate-binding protein [Eubacteriales bacterium]|nr:rhamnose ABC transporter substrate-binding protein [Eubacteriales bacterium]
MKKRVLSLAMAMTMVGTMLAGCAKGGDTTSSTPKSTPSETTSSKKTGEDTKKDDGGKKKYAIVTKATGNPYMEKSAEGFKEVIEAAGGEAVIKHPEAATADAQVSVIQSLISQGVDSIAIAGNDANALQAALEDAMAAGIKVSAFDSNVNADSRQVFANQAGVQEIGQTLMDAVYDITGGEGQWAVLSATSQATNQNAWIDAMKEIMKDEKYAKLELVEVAYGDDEPQKSTDQTQALLQKYPDLKVICAPTTVGINAAAKVLQDEKSPVKLTGLGLPSEMAAYIGDDDAHSCPYMYLWNPIELGKLAAHTSIALVDGTITGKEGDAFKAGDMGDYKVVAASDGGTEIILGAPFKFDPSNIAEWKDVY